MNFLYSIAPEVIKFPQTDEELETVSMAFANVSGFPNVIGCVDGTYINIRTPKYKIRNTYANRHHSTALTLQGICDNNKRFVDAFTGVSGKLHDSRVFRLSFISNNICGDTYHILGDSAYPIAPYLMTPFRDYGHLNRDQQTFNFKFSATRVLIEQTFGLLKGRFRQLLHLDFHTVERCSYFIMSCCVLHNICIDNNDIWEEPFEEEVGEPPVFEQQRDDLRRRGEAKRNRICATIRNNIFI